MNQWSGVAFWLSAIAMFISSTIALYISRGRRPRFKLIIEADFKVADHVAFYVKNKTSISSKVSEIYIKTGIMKNINLGTFEMSRGAFVGGYVNALSETFLCSLTPSSILQELKDCLEKMDKNKPIIFFVVDGYGKKHSGKSKGLTISILEKESKKDFMANIFPSNNDG